MDNFATSNTGYCIRTNNIQPRSTKPKCNPFHKCIIGIRGWDRELAWVPIEQEPNQQRTRDQSQTNLRHDQHALPIVHLPKRWSKNARTIANQQHSIWPSRHSWSNRLTTTTINVRIRHLHRSSPLTLNQNGYRCFARGKIRTWGKWGKIIYVLKTFTSEINRDRTPPSP